MKRLFCAVKIIPGAGVIKMLNDFRNTLSNERINWVDPLNMHLTLKFFGDTPAAEEADIIDALKPVTDYINTFTFNIAGCGFFGSPGMPRVVWAGIRETKGLEKLYQQVNHQLAPLGYEPDKKNFVPHLTLGRIKNLQNRGEFQHLLKKHKNDHIGVQKVDRFYLYQSKLHPQGPVYHILKEYVLQDNEQGRITGL